MTVTPSVLESVALSVEVRVVAAAAMSSAAVELPATSSGIVRRASIWTEPDATRSSRKQAGSWHPSDSCSEEERLARAPSSKASMPAASTSWGVEQWDVSV